LPDPTIEEVIDRVRVTIHVLSHNPADAREHGESLDRGTKSEHHDGAPSTPTTALTPDKLTVLHQMETATASRAEIMSALGITNQTRAFQRHVEPLIDAGLVERTIPDKPTSRLQRYRITDAGRTCLNRLSGDAE